MALSAAVDTGPGVTPTSWPAGEVFRDITRGGLAALIVGILVGGVGARLMMRAAALLVPEAEGSFTENGNRIGDITLGGTMGLVIFGGLLVTLFLATIWVSISPWLPGGALAKGVLAMPIAIAFAARGLVDGRNPDFDVLGHDPGVVAVILVLVALTAPAVALTDAWLDRRLPHAAADDGSNPGGLYIAASLVGAIFGGLVILTSGGGGGQALQVTLLVVSLITVGWWWLRVHGATRPPLAMTIAARAVLVVGTVWGFALLAPNLERALGLD